MMTYIGITILIVAIFLILTREKVNFIKDRNQSKKLTAKVIEYRHEKISKGDKMARYPYVKIGDDDTILRRLKYQPSIIGRYLQVGNHIPVFWNGLDLMYWGEFDIGILKYFPKNWNFIIHKKRNI